MTTAEKAIAEKTQRLMERFAPRRKREGTWIFVHDLNCADVYGALAQAARHKACIDPIALHTLAELLSQAWNTRPGPEGE